MKIKFNDIFKSINYLDYIEDLFSNYDYFRTKKYSLLSLELLKKRFSTSSLWLTHSATGALEMIAKAIQIQPGDEVILSSFTFVSTANAFVNHGAHPVFVDISEEDFNLDVNKIEEKITKRTKAIVITHYAGHATDLNFLKQLCEKYDLFLIEDAAMALGNYYDGKPLGTIGDFGVISFDITKQISAIQGGLLICNRSDYQNRLDNIYHIGTDRTQFMQQNKPYYEWVSVGSKYQMNELNAVTLYDNLLHEETLFSKRKAISKAYFRQLKTLEKHDVKMLPESKLEDNIHLFYLLMPSNTGRDTLMQLLKEKGVEAIFHYIPLHSSTMGQKYGIVDLPTTTSVSGRLLRLPLHVNLEDKDISTISEFINLYLYGRN